MWRPAFDLTTIGATLMTVISDLDVALEAARAGAAIVRNAMGRVSDLRFKSSDVDPVTATDHASDQAILEVIRRYRPDDATLTEESGGAGWDGARVWIADPLDGTVNFLHGLPNVSVSVALWDRGAPVAGVVVDVGRDEEYVAEPGSGAEMNGSRVEVSSIADPGRALTVTGFPYDRRTNAAHYADVLAGVLANVQGIRRTGSAALDMCYVAAGRFDAYWEDGPAAWDAAAGVLIATEAGGRVSDYSGHEYQLGSGSLLVSNGHLHDAMTAILRP